MKGSGRAEEEEQRNKEWKDCIKELVCKLGAYNFRGEAVLNVDRIVCTAIDRAVIRNILWLG